VNLTLTSDRDGVHLVPAWKFDPEAVDGLAYTGDDQLTRGSGTGSGCADVWGSPAVDPSNGLVFFGTGSCSDATAAAAVGEHVWAISMTDGHRVWSYRPHDDVTGLLDDDFGGAPNLLPHGMVGAGSKDGWYYALDRRTGALRWKTQVGQPGHATPDFAVGGILASAATGTVNSRDAIFTATAISTPNDPPLSDGPQSSPPSVLDDPGRMFSLDAIDAQTGAILWRSPVARQAYGPPTFVNGVVLVPCTFDFQIDAFDANTGLPLAARPVTGPPSSAPTALGDSVYGGIGTSTSVGSPLAVLGGVYAMQVVPGL
jgi:polyvinyl alcohol dehydrogenase (cytochrome)